MSRETASRRLPVIITLLVGLMLTMMPLPGIVEILEEREAAGTSRPGRRMRSSTPTGAKFHASSRTLTTSETSRLCRKQPAAAPMDKRRMCCSTGSGDRTRKSSWRLR